MLNRINTIIIVPPKDFELVIGYKGDQAKYITLYLGLSTWRNIEWKST